MDSCGGILTQWIDHGIHTTIASPFSISCFPWSLNPQALRFLNRVPSFRLDCFDNGIHRKHGAIDSPSNRNTPQSKSSLGLSWDGLLCYIAALKFQIHKANWEVDREKLYSVRYTVFVEEQKVPEEFEEDELDPVARHLLATLEDGAPIGTARWTDEGGGDIRVGRVAVLRELRRCGVGSLLIDTLLEDAKNDGFLTAHLHAQVSSILFYSNLGFSETDDPEFEEAGIPHRMMERKL